MWWGTFVECASAIARLEREGAPPDRVAEAFARISTDVARRVHGRHALATQSEHGHFATTPNRMLAPSGDVQGHQWEPAKTQVLLLEVSSNDGLGHHFGEGVYQFWITPDDLKARRFDKVELSADAR